jgi:hypothetical protein
MAADALDDYAGRFRYGYDSDDINKVFETIQALTRVDLICVWDYFDDAGYGGDSQFYVVDGDATYELAGDLWPWLSAGTDEAPNGPGSVASWKGGRTPFAYTELSGDGSRNYAFESRN